MGVLQYTNLTEKLSCCHKPRQERGAKYITTLSDKMTTLVTLATYPSLTHVVSMETTTNVCKITLTLIAVVMR